MDLNHSLEPGKDQVGLARQVLYMETEPETHRMAQLSDRHFRRSVAGADAAHVLRTPFWGKTIGHTAKSSGRSEMSLTLFPLTMMFKISLESASRKLRVESMSSGSAM